MFTKLTTHIKKYLETKVLDVDFDGIYKIKQI